MAFNVVATVTLLSYRNASLFWIMLWLVSGATDHGMIPVGLTRLCSRKEITDPALLVLLTAAGDERCAASCCGPKMAPDGGLSR